MATKRVILQETETLVTPLIAYMIDTLRHLEQRIYSANSEITEQEREELQSVLDVFSQAYGLLEVISDRVSYPIKSSVEVYYDNLIAD